jgi:predicted nucleotidyltransferase
MDRDARIRKLSAEAERITRALVDRGATLVVAFGSFARGNIASASDLDLIAVLESDLPFLARLQELYGELRPRVGLDLLAYTPKEFEEMRLRSFVRQALAEGRVLYAA